MDNGSIDATQTIISSFVGRLPIRSIIEPRQGISHARNAAFREVRGETMVWTDDDTIPDTGWLRAYEVAFVAYPSDALFGGLIQPVLEQPVTPWFRDARPALAWLMAERDLGEAPIPLTGENDSIPFGANYAVRTAVQRQFPMNLDYGAGTSLFGEETSSFKEMLQAGHTGRWTPDAIVQHLISPDRQTERYVRWWFNMLGRTATHLGRTADGPRVFGVPRWLWRRGLELELRYWIARWRSPPSVWVQLMVHRAFLEGQVRYFREQTSG